MPPGPAGPLVGGKSGAPGFGLPAGAGAGAAGGAVPGNDGGPLGAGRFHGASPGSTVVMPAPSRSPAWGSLGGALRGRRPYGRWSHRPKAIRAGASPRAGPEPPFA